MYSGWGIGFCKQARSNKQGKVTQHTQGSHFPTKNELPRVGLEPTGHDTLHSRQSALYQLSWLGPCTCGARPGLLVAAHSVVHNLHNSVGAEMYTNKCANHKPSHDMRSSLQECNVCNEEIMSPMHHLCQCWCAYNYIVPKGILACANILKCTHS